MGDGDLAGWGPSGRPGRWAALPQSAQPSSVPQREPTAHGGRTAQLGPGQGGARGRPRSPPKWLGAGQSRRARGICSGWAVVARRPGGTRVAHSGLSCPFALPRGPGSASDPQTLHLSFPGLWAQQGEPPAWAPGRHRPPSRARGPAPAPCRGRGHVVHPRLCPEPASTAPSSAVPGDSRPPGAPAWPGRQATGRGRKNNNRDSAGRSLWRGRRAVRGPTAGGLRSAAGPRGGRSCEGPRGGRVVPRGSAVSHLGAESGQRGDRRRGREGVRGAPCAALGGLCGIRLSVGEARARACAGSWEGSREDLCERGGDSVGLRSYVGSSVGTVWGQSRAAA